MAADKTKSLIMAQRLKELRTGRGLSHESLRKALMDKYEIDISVDSLKNYEVSKTPHAKAYKNDGMRVEYLRCLSDFYGVSSDFILGITDVKSTSKGVQSIIKNTGLSEQSAVALRAISMANREADPSEFKRILPVPKNWQSAGDYVYLAAMAQSFVNDMIGAMTSDELILRRYGTLMTSLIVKNHQEMLNPAGNPFFEDGHIAVPIDDYVAFLIHEITERIARYLSQINQEGVDLLMMEYGKD